jgi:signal-transduction protein with cAMP-binding, CBS, and nucleotidyltransferase domain
MNHEERAMQVRDLMNADFSSISQDKSITTADRDMIVRIIADDADPNATPVVDAMSTEIIVCVEDDELEHAANIMMKYRIRRLMVRNSSGDYVGMLSLADVVQHRSAARLCAHVLEEITRCEPMLRCDTIVSATRSEPFR